MEPHPGDFLTYECEIYIDVPPERVFAVVGNLENSVRWTDARPVRSISQVSEGPLGEGTWYRSSEKITMPFHADTEILVYRPPEQIVWRSKPVGERVPYHRWSFTLRGQDGGTRLTHSVRAARASGYMGLVQRLGFIFTRPRATVPGNMQRSLTRIKAMVEEGAETEVPTP